MLQLSSTALKTQLNMPCKVLYHSTTPCDVYSINYSPYVEFEILNSEGSILLDIMFHVSPLNKSQGGSNQGILQPRCDGSCDLSNCHRSSYVCSQFKVTLEVWGVAPTCWNHCSYRVKSLRLPKAVQNIGREHGCVTTSCSQLRVASLQSLWQ